MRLIVLLAPAPTLAAAAGRAAAQQTPGAPDSTRRPAARDVDLAVSGYLQTDARWVSPTARRGDDGPLLRRARLLFDATAPGGWALRLQPDFGLGRVQIQDAYVALQRTAARGALEARAGRFRPAFGVERTQSSSTLLFPERSAVNTVMPSRALGAQLLATRGALTLALGAFHSAAGRDAASADTDGDPEAGPSVGYDLLARAVWRAGAGVEVHAATMRGTTDGTADEPGLARVLTVGQQPAFAFANDEALGSGAVARADGLHARHTLGLRQATRRVLAGAEVVASSQRVARGAWRGTLPVQAWAARAAYVWRGSRGPGDEVRPDTGARSGAVEVGTRAGGVRVGRAAVERVASDGTPPAVTLANGGVAVSWLPSARTRLAASYDYTALRRLPAPAGTPGRPAAPGAEHALVVRVQQAF